MAPGREEHRIALLARSTRPTQALRRNVKELLRTNDAVLLSWIDALLADAEIRAMVLDAHTSVAEGSIGALPRRLMVPSPDEVKARRILGDAGIALSES